MNQFEMKQLAYQSQLKSRALQVLLYLIDRANKEQTCFPAVPTIGRELHISISTVKRAMRELVEAGYVTKESRFREGNRGQTSNLYTLFFTEDRTEQQKEETKIQQEEQPVNVSEKQMAKEEQFENTKNCAGESSVYVDVTGGGGQNDTTLNSQFNQELKGEKEVFTGKSRLFQFLGNGRPLCPTKTVCHVCLFGAKKAGTHDSIFAVAEPDGINTTVAVSGLVSIPCVKVGILVHGTPDCFGGMYAKLSDRFMLPKGIKQCIGRFINLMRIIKPVRHKKSFLNILMFGRFHMDRI